RSQFDWTIDGETCPLFLKLKLNVGAGNVVAGMGMNVEFRLLDEVLKAQAPIHGVKLNLDMEVQPSQEKATIGISGSIDSVKQGKVKISGGGDMDQGGGQITIEF